MGDYKTFVEKEGPWRPWEPPSPALSLTALENHPSPQAHRMPPRATFPTRRCDHAEIPPLPLVPHYRWQMNIYGTSAKHFVLTVCIGNVH